MRMARSAIVGSKVLIISMGLVVGCGIHVEPPPPPGEAEENLSKIGRAYMEASAGLKHPPRNAGELAPFLEKVGASESVLRSPRDNQDFVILWDVKSSELAPETDARGSPL